MQELYELGARKLGIINVGPVGCVPRVRVLNATGGCADGMNQLAAGFDAALESLLAGLAAELPGMAYSLADSFGFTALTDPLAAGFVSADSACCGGGRLGAEADCLPGPPCSARRPTTTARPSSPSPSSLSSGHSRRLLDFRHLLIFKDSPTH